MVTPVYCVWGISSIVMFKCFLPRWIGQCRNTAHIWDSMDCAWNDSALLIFTDGWRRSYDNTPRPKVCHLPKITRKVCHREKYEDAQPSKHSLDFVHASTPKSVVSDVKCNWNQCVVTVVVRKEEINQPISKIQKKWQSHHVMLTLI